MSMQILHNYSQNLKNCDDRVQHKTRDALVARVSQVKFRNAPKIWEIAHSKGKKIEHRFLRFQQKPWHLFFQLRD